MENVINPEDFNLIIKYKLFDILHSIPKNPMNNEVSSWIITGHDLNNSSEKRCFSHNVMSYPISIYIIQVKHSSVETLSSNNFISSNKEDLIQMKKIVLNEMFDKMLLELNSNI